MALRDQPYLPLYVQDFLTDEKLANCSAESTGVYIRLMCLMHKSHDYGKILLRQKEQQSEQQILNFAEKLARQMPYKTETISRALEELVDEEVVYIDDNALCQKRMIKDALLSEKRSKSGKKGAESSNKRFKPHPKFATAKYTANETAKHTANTENEIEYENEIEIVSESNCDNPFQGELHEAFDDWIAYKVEKRQPYKPRGLKSLITQVSRYAEQFGEAETANAIRNSMASNYSGIVFDRIGRNGEKPQRGTQAIKQNYEGSRDFFDD